MAGRQSSLYARARPFAKKKSKPLRVLTFGPRGFLGLAESLNIIGWSFAVMAVLTVGKCGRPRTNARHRGGICIGISFRRHPALAMALDAVFDGGLATMLLAAPA
jgi:hypothetical protein